MRQKGRMLVVEMSESQSCCLAGCSQQWVFPLRIWSSCLLASYLTSRLNSDFLAVFLWKGIRQEVSQFIILRVKASDPSRSKIPFNLPKFITEFMHISQVRLWSATYSQSSSFRPVTESMQNFRLRLQCWMQLSPSITQTKGIEREVPSSWKTKWVESLRSRISWLRKCGYQFLDFVILCRYEQICWLSWILLRFWLRQPHSKSQQRLSRRGLRMRVELRLMVCSLPILSCWEGAEDYNTLMETISAVARLWFLTTSNRKWRVSSLEKVTVAVQLQSSWVSSCRSTSASSTTSFWEQSSIEVISQRMKVRGCWKAVRLRQQCSCLCSQRSNRQSLSWVFSLTLWSILNYILFVMFSRVLYFLRDLQKSSYPSFALRHRSTTPPSDQDLFSILPSSLMLCSCMLASMVTVLLLMWKRCEWMSVGGVRASKLMTLKVRCWWGRKSSCRCSMFWKWGCWCCWVQFWQQRAQVVLGRVTEMRSMSSSMGWAASRARCSLTSAMLI